MSTTLATVTTTTLDLVVQQLSIYFGIPTLFIGIIGNAFNIIVFLSLHTFRQNSCVFYLTIMSIVNIFQLATGLFTRILISGFDIDWTLSSLFFCKFRNFLFQTSSLISFTCITLATIDQYLATSPNQNWQQYCDIKQAYRISIFFLILWTLHGIPYLFMFNHTVVSDAGQVICHTSNIPFTDYRSYFVSLILTGFLPVFLTAIFGILAFHNVRTIQYRTVPLVRRALDQQLTVMVLTQVLMNFFTTLPSAIMSAVDLDPHLMSNTNTASTLISVTIIAVLIYYLYFAVSRNFIRHESLRKCLLNWFSVHSTFIYLHRNDFVGNGCSLLQESIIIIDNILKWHWIKLNLIHQKLPMNHNSSSIDSCAFWVEIWKKKTTERRKPMKSHSFLSCCRVNEKSSFHKAMSSSGRIRKRSMILLMKKKI